VNPSLNLNLKIKASEEKKEECNEIDDSALERAVPVVDETASGNQKNVEKLEILETKRTRQLTNFQKRAMGIMGTPKHFCEMSKPLEGDKEPI